MYDGHIGPGRFNNFMDEINKGLWDDGYDMDTLTARIQEAYEEGELSSSQYDKLMREIEDISS
ncbi:MAG: hypothetical protein LBI54_10350 [Lachnospiraceae bacterium]|jgi:hypothetical protein|nr:hypothetical protein [Lachnospiraceae bacterium]